MPNKTILDRLNKILKTREHALDRFDRREQLLKRFPLNPEWYDGNADAFKYAPDEVKREHKRLVKAKQEADELNADLDDAAGIEYDRIIRSKPGKRIEREAIRMMPDHLVRDNGWY